MHKHTLYKPIAAIGPTSRTLDHLPQLLSISSFCLQILFLYHFLTHDAMLVWSMMSLFVCPSHAGIVTEWLNMGSRKQHTITQGL